MEPMKHLFVIPSTIDKVKKILPIFSRNSEANDSELLENKYVLVTTCIVCSNTQPPTSMLRRSVVVLLLVLSHNM